MWHNFKEKLKSIARQYRTRLWVLEGREKSSGEFLRLVYAGSVPHKNYIAALVFDDDVKEKYLGKTWIWHIRGNINREKNNVSLQIVEMNNASAKVLGKKTDYYVPAWFDAIIDFSVSQERLVKSKSIKRDLKNIRKHQLEYEVTTDPQKFDLFYHEMYVPYITKAHGNRSLLMSLEKMRQRMNSSELLMVKKGDQYISGGILLYNKDIVHGWKLGVLDGNREYIKYGAAASIYYFEMVYLTEKGYKKINHGGTRAFLKDGVFQIKKKWGMNVGDCWDIGFMITPLQMTTAVVAFLQSNPFMFVRNNKKYFAVFLEPDADVSEELIYKIHKQYYVSGIEKLIIYTTNKSQLVFDLPDELLNDVELSQYCTKMKGKTSSVLDN